MLQSDFPAETQRYGEFRFCPRCGGPFAAGDFDPAACLFTCRGCGFDFYQNPVPAAVVALQHPADPSSFLMLRRRTKPGVGLWCVPGGFIGYGEPPEAAAAREVREEVGVEARIEGVIRAGLVDYTYRARQICIVEIAFRAVPTGPLPAPGAATAEASEIAFHRLEDLLADPARLAFPEQAEIFRCLGDEVHRR